MRVAVFFTTVAVALFASLPADAIEGYPAEVTNQFVSWCTGTQNQPETVCTCAINKATLEIPAAAMASFLSAAEGGAATSMSSGVGATTLQIIATCVTGGVSTGSSGGTMLKSLGTTLGQ
ncbi:MAG: hypothetical protein HQ513_15005 [Rhodospirillales bacterium]|nr:hypothetical protein [Rhodospirillales bacterium]